jgi:hypothetical protein
MMASSASSATDLLAEMLLEIVELRDDRLDALIVLHAPRRRIAPTFSVDVCVRRWPDRQRSAWHALRSTEQMTPGCAVESRESR